MMSSAQNRVVSLLRDKQLVKVIAGINNFDIHQVERIVQAATETQAGAIDIAARPEIVRHARQLTDLPLFASAVDPEALAIALINGADVAELGNFDALYESGFYLSAEEVITLAEKTKALIPSEALLSVTIPGYLTMDTQIRMAEKLASMDVAMIQTEGASRVVKLTKTVHVLSPEEKARLNFENTQALTRAIALPVISASGIGVHNVMEAFDCGASGVGIGSAINRLNTSEEMVTCLTQVMTQVNHAKAADKTRQAVLAS